ncbi:hypothetical protein [Helicobacter felis]|uniref:hypothetical protein n=1 Tax=Helicobacter felis TaxID=214 RepID=UPI000CF0DE56|nr:hypothetical protein [Helicobacter felis]
MNYWLYLCLALGLALGGALWGVKALLEKNALLKERLETTRAHLQAQNQQIKALELDTKKYHEQKQTQIKVIRERYKDPKALAQLKTCEEKLRGVQELLEVFKSSFHPSH